MAVTISMLVFVLIVAFTLACLVILSRLANNRAAKLWYVFFLVSYVLWHWGLFSRTGTLGPGWLYGLPLAWIAGTLALGFPKLGNPPPAFPNRYDEPRVTQEQLQGRSGTHQALQLYFAILTLLFVLATVALYSRYFSFLSRFY